MKTPIQSAFSRGVLPGLRLLTLGALIAAGCGKAGSQDPSGQPAEGATDQSASAPMGPHGGALVRLAPAALRNAALEIGAAGPAAIAVRLEAPGEVKVNRTATAEVRPPYAGVVRRLPVDLGTHVRAGDVVAIIHSNESLTDYEVSSPIDGTLLGRGATLGETVDANSPLATIADLSTVWAEFSIYPGDIGRIRTGQHAEIRPIGESSIRSKGTVRYVSSTLDVDTRSGVGRIVLSNPQREWMPGLPVMVSITLDIIQVPVAVPSSAIVRDKTGSAVFLAVPGGFELLPITLGRTDGTRTEVLSGLSAGMRIVTRNAFALQAELGKSEGGDED